MNLRTSEIMHQAEMAMGSAAAVMQQWQFLHQMGWHNSINPDTIIRMAGRNDQVRALIWC